MQYKKKSDKREVKCILHAISDIPNGVTIETALLGGDVVYEGTPIGKASNGMYNVCKTAKVVEQASGSSTTLKISKGSHFKAKDSVSDGTNTAQSIKSIDKSNQAYDVITLSATLGETIESGVVIYESDDTNPKVVPTAIVGTTYSVEAGNDMITSGLIHCVVRESIAPPVNQTIKDALKVVVYI